MTEIVNIFNFGLVLIFGLFLSVYISGSWETTKQRNYIIALCPALLLIQGIFMIVWDESVVEKLYPFITHLPIVLSLMFVLKKDADVSIVSVLTAYLCCQLPHWAQIALDDITGYAIIGALGYTVCIIGIYILLRHFFVRNAYAAITYSKRTLILFGVLPFIYYLFDYVTTVYTDVMYIGSKALYEFLPTLMAIFYVIFLAVYHMQVQEKTKAEISSSILNEELKQSVYEIETLRKSAFQTSVYRHDMRHHLNIIDKYISVNEPGEAVKYIASIRSDIDAITPKTFCENEVINLLCSSFSSKAEELGIELEIDILVPKEISVPNTELCSVISNALENAFNAASSSEHKWVRLYCVVKNGKLLVEVKNTYSGNVAMIDGVPVSQQAGHGYGCLSIKTIAEKNGGICVFETDGKEFIMRVIIPVLE